LPLDQLQIVLDENLPWSIAGELKARGYAATSNYVLNASGLKDPEWLQVVGAGGKLTPLRRLKTHPSEDVGGASVGLMSLARS